MFKNLILIAFVITGLSGCEALKPKNFGQRTIDFDGSNDTTNSDNFRFNFGYVENTAAAPLDRVVILQGAPNSKPVINSTCNLAGTNCVCEFYNDSDVLLETTNSTDMSYDSVGNYLRCVYNGNLANLKKVRVRNQNSSKFSDTYAVETPATLTLQKLIGGEQDINQVRTISRYTCLYNFLQKQGTTELLFDCSSQGSTCWSGFSSNGLTSGDWCLLQASIPFHLYRSNYENNYGAKFADKLYYSEGDGLVCRNQVKQYDCAGSNGVPVKDFGLFATQAGIFDTPLSLTPAPGSPVVNYGYGAAVSTYGSATTCPPGMVKRIFFKAQTSNIQSVGPTHNMPNTLTATEIRDPANPPTPLEVNKVGGGDCDANGNCTLPTVGMGMQVNYGYSSSGQTTFCVIDPNLLP